MKERTLDDISRMLIEHQCARLSDLYCEHLDHRNPDAFARLFTEDASYKPAIQPTPIVGREDILRWIHSYPKDRFVRHLATNRLVEPIDGNSARGTSYALTFREPNPREGAISIRSMPRALVEYVDTYRRTEDGWKFASRYYNFSFLDNEETNRPAWATL